MAMNSKENRESACQDEDESAILIWVSLHIGIKYVRYTCMRCKVCLSSADWCGVF